MGGIDREPLLCRSQLKTVTNQYHCSTEQSVLNDTAADKCAFELTSDEDDTELQSRKCECKRCEFSTFIFHFLL